MTWTILLFYILGLHFCQVAVQDHSTQMYYIKLTIDKNTISNVTENLLKPFGAGANVTVEQLKMTTSCAFDEKGAQVCECESGHLWSQTACQSQYKCCGNGPCPGPYTCASDLTVQIHGSLELTAPEYQKCLAEKTSQDFKDCNGNLTNMLKEAYSYLYGFEGLTITHYRVGSVIADFEAVIVSNVDPSFLQKTSQRLVSVLGAKLNLETSGVVRLTVPSGPVNNGANVDLSCTTETDLNSKPQWLLKNKLEKEIYNGTESTIITSNLESTVRLTIVSKLWAGKYTCLFRRVLDSVTIFHKATVDMDVCIVPNVDIRSDPAFPLCVKDDGLVLVTANCEVEQSYEVYTVNWERQDIDAEVIPLAYRNSTETVIFSASTYVSCNPARSPKITCILTNRCNQTAKSSININRIQENEPYCKAEGQWQNTKTGYQAEIKCSDLVGSRKRKCNLNTIWDKEESFCVNPELQYALSNADVVDTGLGALDKNAANVFSHLQSVTNNTKNINSAANIETSVSVLNTLSGKLPHIHDRTTVNEFLKSSSNLLEKTLNDSWTNTREIDNKTIAERYLSSVEQLIQKATVNKENKEANIEVVSCDETKESKCNNKVFNVSVTVRGVSPGLVKTAGFQTLENYLPNRDQDYSPNSIVVSTTIDNKHLSDMNVDLEFPLSQPRPRNVPLKCVFWDNTTREWSDKGCTWLGAGRCHCTHLSSFAILISKSPLEVAYISEVTYVGLSVSILSLILCLATELIIWNDVVKSDTLYLRHCAQVNISVCLLMADVCFVASSLPRDLNDNWCKTLVLLEHFFYLSMFFWMLSLSSILLHKTVYLSLDGVSKTAYLRFSIILGYVCPLLIAMITVLTYNGEEGRYYSKDTRWLVYDGVLKGAIFTFIFPVGIIVFVNAFFMCLVILKLVQPLKAQQILHNKEKNSAKTVVRSVILLTPVFGLTWLFGFAVIITDLTSGLLAYVVNYLFVLMNAFQGLFIFLTTCVGDRMVREGLRSYFRKGRTAVSFISNSTTSIGSSVKK